WLILASGLRASRSTRTPPTASLTPARRRPVPPTRPPAGTPGSESKPTWRPNCDGKLALSADGVLARHHHPGTVAMQVQHQVVVVSQLGAAADADIGNVGFPQEVVDAFHLGL